jgi:hypothetical protein
MTSRRTDYRPADSRFTETLRSQRLFFGVVAAYVVVTVALTSRFQYSLYPDATSYLSIAQAYSRGQFHDAVNGYWAPLYCWLLAPLLAAGVDTLLAPKLLAVLIGVATLIGLRRLCRRIDLTAESTSVVLIAALPSLVCWSLTYITPDFLLAGVLTWYLAEVAGWSPASGAKSGLIAGALGGLAYFSKQYALPFVAAHLVFVGALRFHQYRRHGHASTVARWLVAAAAVLLATVGPWIAVMSNKYGQLTIAASGTYNWYLPATGFNVGTRILAPPPFPGAVSAWVDPTPYAHTATSRTVAGHNANPLVPRWWGFKAALDQVGRDALMLETFTFLALPILGAAVVLGVRDIGRSADYRLLHLALATALFFGGYQIVSAYLVERLLWIVILLLLVLGALLFERLAASARLRSSTRLVLVAILALSFWPLPLLRLVQGVDEGRDVHATAQALARRGVSGRLATVNRYADSLRVAFFTESAYYGRIAPPVTIEQVLAELQAHEIDFLLVWAEKNPEASAFYQDLTRRFPDATQGSVPDVAALDVRSLRRAARP